MHLFYLTTISLLLLPACGSNSSKDSAATSSYAFEADASALLKSSTMELHRFPLETGPEHLCATGQTISCAAVTALTGKLLTVGLTIQAGGSGLQSYLLTDSFSEVDGDSTAYDFDFSNPVKTGGSLSCCGGAGDLTSGNTYFSNANFLFSYIDASFDIPYTNPGQVNTAMLATQTVRFVLATQTSSGYHRGDLLMKDTDGSFKWLTSSGTMSATRPDAPITMDTQVVNYTNPFDQGNAEIPVISTDILSPEGDDAKVTTSEEALKTSDKTYSFDFDASSLIVFMLAPSELSIIQSKAELLKRIHLQGLPHSKFTFGSSATSMLTITEDE